MIGAAALAASACADLDQAESASSSPQEDPHQISQALLGRLGLDAQTCLSPDDEPFLRQAQQALGHVVASPAFEQCLARSMRGGWGPQHELSRVVYRQCWDFEREDTVWERAWREDPLHQSLYRGSGKDPFFGQGVERQTDGVLAALRALGSLHLVCQGAPWPAAHAEQPNPYFAQDWVGPARQSLRRFTYTVLHGPTFESYRAGGRVAQMASILTTSALRQHGWHLEFCSSDPDYWHPSAHAAPHIAARCVNAVLDASSACSTSCPAGSRALVRSLDQPGCECVQELGVHAVGALAFGPLSPSTGRRQAREAVQTLTHGQPLDGAEAALGFDHPDAFAAKAGSAQLVGRFDSTPGEDVLWRDAQTGDLLVTSALQGQLTPSARWSNADVQRTPEGSWRLRPDDQVLPWTGEFDGDERHEFLIRHGDDFAIVGVEPRPAERLTAKLVLHRALRQGRPLGQTEQFKLSAGMEPVAVGDFLLNVDGDEIVWRRPDGALWVQAHAGRRDAAGASGAFIAATFWPGDSLGGWALSAQTQIIGAGRFTRADRAQLLVRSDWGVGVLDLQDARSCQLAQAPACGQPSPVKMPFGSTLLHQQWTLQPSDLLWAQGIGDLDGDGLDEVLIKNDQQLGVLTHVGWLGRFYVPRVMWTGGSLGGWAWSAQDQLVVARGLGQADRAQVVAASPWGMGLLALRQDRLEAEWMQAARGLIGQWSTPWLGGHDRLRIVGSADLSGQQGSRALIAERVNVSLRR